jgi:hypothetical protein
VQVLFQRPPVRIRRASCPGNGLSSDHDVGRVNNHAHAGASRSGLALGITPTFRLVMPGHLASFARWTAFPSSLAGRDSGDYYEASVDHRTRVP